MSSPEKNVSCVFVRNISFALDKQTVEDAFGEIGPIRNCFLVKEKGQSRHKGIGFVQFAIPEDADRAVAALNKSTLGNRQILVPPSPSQSPSPNSRQPCIVRHPPCRRPELYGREPLCRLSTQSNGHLWRIASGSALMVQWRSHLRNPLSMRKSAHLQRASPRVRKLVNLQRSSG